MPQVGVPLGTLISLLKNAKGEVKLSVPISGNVASRELSFDDAFWAVVRKTAVGVATLPLSWVGKIFYSEDARVETVSIWPVYFEAGTTTFDADAGQEIYRLRARASQPRGPIPTPEDSISPLEAAGRRR
jgi:hypothetical protein